ncbi:MAG: AMP-binding protein, partial [Thermostichales cyanobacterium SZTDM-1c_bins_54]
GLSFATIWQEVAQKHGDRIALRDPHAEPVLELTYRQVYEQIAGFAGGLQALGVQVGDRVAIIDDNSPRWIVADMGSLLMGAVNVPRSAVADPQELAYVIRHSGSQWLIVENVKTWQRLAPHVQDLGIRDVILLSNESYEGCLNFVGLLKKGYAHGFQAPALPLDHLATLIYTSGTTGQPKGVMLTHGNLLHQVEYLDVVVQPQPGDKILTILPTWHSYERACEYFLLSRACTLVYTNPKLLKKDFTAENPHFLIAVPRIWESVYEGIHKQFKEKSPGQQKLIRFLLAQSETYILNKRIVTGTSIRHLHSSPATQLAAALRMAWSFPFHRLAHALIFKKVRAAIGSNFKQAISGGGSLPDHIDTFFEMAGICILNGYGLTETSPVLTARRPENNVRGTIGLPIPKTEIQIRDPDTQQVLPPEQKGIIWARGPQVMKGYYQNPEATAKVMDAQGWFNTGDLGWLTPDGQLVITGRAKDTIVLRNGENIEPQPIEDVCLQSPYISQIIVVGQDQKRLAALIYPNLEELHAWAASQGIPEREQELLATAAVKELLRKELLQRVKQRFGYRPDDQISDFRFIPEPCSVENGLMTQTLKLRRNLINERYRDLIQSMFQEK